MFVNMGVCRADAKIEKDCYQPNEMIKIDMKVNNSNCAQAISKIKMTLKREVVCYS